MAIPGFISPVGLSNTEELITYLNELVSELQFTLSKLDHQNINVLNYVPLKSNASLGNATPQAGWVRAIQSSGITNLQYYSTAWITLMKFSTAYQTNSAGGHNHTVSIASHTHEYVWPDATTHTTVAAGSTSITTATTGAHTHILITT